MRLEDFAEQFVIGSIRGGGSFDPDLGNDRRNPAATSELRFVGRACKGCFDDFDRRSGGVVFRAKGDHGSATMQDIANELKRCCAHDAIGVDAQGDVVNRLAAVNRFGNHQPLVFAPRETSVFGGSTRVNNGAFFCGSGKQTTDHGAQAFNRRRLNLALIRCKHRLERIG
ncbi:MAG TPA: hypothetical protein VKE42_03895, partial [Candidatus Cybelea sp.]|nr:hypothetical protein [Candidatus Cybelea sp.]